MIIRLSHTSCSVNVFLLLPVKREEKVEQILAAARTVTVDQECTEKQTDN